MKNMKYLYALLVIFMFSCEEVIELDLNDGQQRLVIDASINWEKGTSGSDQEIKLSLSSPYYQNENLAATGANVQIISSNNEIFEFEFYHLSHYQPFSTPVLTVSIPDV